MIKLNKIQKEILIALFKRKEEGMSPSDIHEYLLENNFKHTLLTTKRALYFLTDNKYIAVENKGRLSSYKLTVLGNLFLEIDFDRYYNSDPDNRFGRSNFNFEIFKDFPKEIFSSEEIKILEESTKYFKKRSKLVSGAILKKEYERFVIEFSWKSSKLEGNTYSLLETEKLLLQNKESKNKTKEETQMIVNHKKAFDYIIDNISNFKVVSKKNLFEVHSLIIENLGISKDFRSKPVGIIGSIYHPLDNNQQILAALDDLLNLVNKCKFPYLKSFLLLFGISYIQAFDDGNKRTARFFAIAILLANGLAPISYRSVDEYDYKMAVICFYELNAIIPIKSIFINQYIFACKNYLYLNVK